MEITNKQVKITISFKANELWIYDEICNHSAKGNWIKDILADFLKGSANSGNITSKNVKIAPYTTSPNKEIDDILGGL